MAADKIDTTNIALFCDFENIALGVRDAKYQTFDINKVLERLLLKGSIVVKKAYCDWDRYKEFKHTMHEAAFELIEIPHVRQSGKNSADIRMVVDALDLCYTKAHVDTFVIISGDSDFSPLVSKLRENNKVVIGIGVKDSTSNLLSANCDEFIFYDDLVRGQKSLRKSNDKKLQLSRDGKDIKDNKDSKDSKDIKDVKDSKDAKDAKEVKDSKDLNNKDLKDTNVKDPKMLAKRQEALDFIVETLEGLVEERGEEDKMWGSMVKQTMKRRRPGFNESYYGYRSFKELVEDAQKQGLLLMNRDEKTGQYTIRLPIDSD